MALLPVQFTVPSGPRQALVYGAFPGYSSHSSLYSLRSWLLKMGPRPAAVASLQDTGETQKLAPLPELLHENLHLNKTLALCVHSQVWEALVQTPMTFSAGSPHLVIESSPVVFMCVDLLSPV